MPIFWNEIRHNAIKFSREWAGVKSESAEKQTFWNEFFQVFGIKRRVVASFEESVKRISGDFLFGQRRSSALRKKITDRVHAVGFDSSLWLSSRLRRRERIFKNDLPRALP